MEFVVKIQTSEGEQKKFKLISFTHWQFIVSYHKAVVNLRLNSEENQNHSTFRNIFGKMNGPNWERVLKVDGPQSGLHRVSGLTRFKNEVISLLSESGRSIWKWTILGRRSTFTPYLANSWKLFPDIISFSLERSLRWTHKAVRLIDCK